MSPLRVLVTRPEPDAARTAAKLAACGRRVLVDPLLHMEPIAVERIPAGPFAALAATSANAMRAASGNKSLDALRSLPVFAVGEHTAEAARAAGFATVVVAGGDATALADSIAGNVKRGSRVLHLAGEERAQDLGALLAPAGIAVEVLVLYRMRQAEELAPATAAALSSSHLDAVLHFSPRSAATFVTLVRRAGLEAAARKVRHLCLSQNVAAPLAAIGAKAEIAAHSNEEALLALLES